MAKSSSTKKSKAPKATKATSKVTKAKRAYSKKFSPLWQELKKELARAQTNIDAAVAVGDTGRAEDWTTAHTHLLLKMRTFSDYKYTNTGKLHC